MLLSIAILLLLLATLIAIGNIAGQVAAALRMEQGDNRGFSSVVGISFLLCVVSWFLIGDQIGLLAFLPAFIDPGTSSLFLSIPYFLLLGRLHRQNRKKNDT